MKTSNMIVKKWDEPIIENFDYNNSIVIAHVNYELTGHLCGTMSSVYVINYSEYNVSDLSSAQSMFTGYSKFVGSINNQDIQITFREDGIHQNGLHSTLRVVESNKKEILELKSEYIIKDNQVLLFTSF